MGPAEQRMNDLLAELAQREAAQKPQPAPEPSP
jgi:hypothetical protein